MSISLKTYLLGCAAVAALAAPIAAVAAHDNGPTPAQAAEQQDSQVSYDLGYQAGSPGERPGAGIVVCMSESVPSLPTSTTWREMHDVFIVTNEGWGGIRILVAHAEELAEL